MSAAMTYRDLCSYRDLLTSHSDLCTFVVVQRHLHKGVVSMAIAKRFSVRHNDVFAHGAYVVAEVRPVNDFNRSTKENKVQERCKDTGMLLWAVDVLDADPDAGKASRTVTVKVAAEHQPVPPAPAAGFPFPAVEFTGLSALPYIEKKGDDYYVIVWSFRAEGMNAPGKAAKASGSSGSAAGGSGSVAA